jgi:hypothetical protein
MTTIHLFFKESEFTTLNVCINNKGVEYTVQNNTIVIETDIEFGVHQLSVAIIQGHRLDITDVHIDGASLRISIYLSYIDQGQQRMQPATVIWETDQIWRLPFGNPVSFWMELVYKKLNNGEFGKNLFDKYYIYYPDSIELDNTFPSVVRSFFKHNFDFVCLEKTTPMSQLPYHPVNLVVNNEKKQLAISEINCQKDWIQEQAHFIAQTQYNRTDPNHDPSKEWIRIYLINGKTLVDPKKFPAVYDLVDSMGLTDIKIMYIGILPPGGYISPHKDRVSSNPYENDLYCNLYIPLSWEQGNYFKFSGTSIIHDSQPLIVNILDYVHSVVNTSNNEQNRIILGIRLSIKNNPNLISNV